MVSECTFNIAIPISSNARALYLCSDWVVRIPGTFRVSTPPPLFVAASARIEHRIQYSMVCWLGRDSFLNEITTSHKNKQTINRIIKQLLKPGDIATNENDVGRAA